VLQPIIEKVWRTCEGAEIRGRRVTLKVKYADFRQITRSRTGQALLSTRAEIEQLSYALLEPLFPVTKGIRLLGMTLSSLVGRHADAFSVAPATNATYLVRA
jgi:DNA polymerase IV